MGEEVGVVVAFPLVRLAAERADKRGLPPVEGGMGCEQGKPVVAGAGHLTRPFRPQSRTTTASAGTFPTG